MYYFIEPEVAGGWGDETVVDRSVHPPKISKLHYQFDGWLGDDLLETFPCFIVSEKLKNDLLSKNLTGFKIDNVKISKSDDFFSESKFSILPNFFWLKINGTEKTTDFKLASDNRLMVSDKALSVLRKHNIFHADINSI